MRFPLSDACLPPSKCYPSTHSLIQWTQWPPQSVLLWTIPMLHLHFIGDWCLLCQTPWRPMALLLWLCRVLLSPDGHSFSSPEDHSGSWEIWSGEIQARDKKDRRERVEFDQIAKVNMQWTKHVQSFYLLYIYVDRDNDTKSRYWDLPKILIWPILGHFPCLSWTFLHRLHRNIPHFFTLTALTLGFQLKYMTPSGLWHHPMNTAGNLFTAPWVHCTLLTTM